MGGKRKRHITVLDGYRNGYYEITFPDGTKIDSPTITLAFKFARERLNMSENELNRASTRVVNINPQLMLWDKNG